jgi:hypothetical protein
MSSQLTDSYLADSTTSKCALDIAVLKEPTFNAYHHRIWRSAMLLSLAGLDHFRYLTSHEHSTVWGTKGGQATARVYEGRIEVNDGGTYYTIMFDSIDGLHWSEWLAAHTDITERT